MYWRSPEGTYNATFGFQHLFVKDMVAKLEYVIGYDWMNKKNMVYVKLHHGKPLQEETLYKSRYIDRTQVEAMEYLEEFNKVLAPAVRELLLGRDCVQKFRKYVRPLMPLSV